MFGSILTCALLLEDILCTLPHPCLTGPLLWHFESNNMGDPLIELDLEEVKALVRQMGFWLSCRLLFSSL